MSKYRIQPTIPSNYKVAVLYKDGYVSLSNQDTIQNACSEMRCLMASIHQCPEAWENILNVWIEEWSK